MENSILSEHFVHIFLLTISIVYCILSTLLIYVNQKKIKICIYPNTLLIITSVLYFTLVLCVLYLQENKENMQLSNSKIEIISNIPIPKITVPKISNVSFLKIYLKTYYKKIPDEIENIIIEAIDDLSCKHKVDFNLIVGMIGVESSFNPYAISSVGARGLMQVRYGVWKYHLNIPNIMRLHNIHEGIEYGILAFLQCRKEAKGNLIMALQKYSGTKNQVYVTKINREINKFKSSKEKQIE